MTTCGMACVRVRVGGGALQHRYMESAVTEKGKHAATRWLPGQDKVTHHAIRPPHSTSSRLAHPAVWQADCSRVPEGMGPHVPGRGGAAEEGERQRRKGCCAARTQRSTGGGGGQGVAGDVVCVTMEGRVCVRVCVAAYIPPAPPGWAPSPSRGPIHSPPAPEHGVCAVAAGQVQLVCTVVAIIDLTKGDRVWAGSTNKRRHYMASNATGPSPS